MAEAAVLNVEEVIPEDTSIESQQSFPFNPIAGTQFNNAGIIQINIENQAEYFLPSQSWLQIDGQLKKEDNQVYPNNSNVALINNAPMYCFSNIKYHLGGNEIESVNEPGHATTMMGLLKYERNSPGLSKCWTIDTSTAALDTNTGWKKRKDFMMNCDPRGSFSFAVSLQHIFGFAEDYDRVVFGLRHSLQLNRKASSNDAIFKAANVDAGLVDIKNVTWWMPRVLPSPVENFRLIKLLEKETTLEVKFRGRQCSTVTVPLATSLYTWNLGVKSERPRFIIVGLQSGKGDNQTQNPALFDHCRVSRMKILLNSVEYPAIDYSTDFQKNNYAGYYKSMNEFKHSFYGVEKMVSDCSIDADDFKNLFPLFVFNVSRQMDKLKPSIVDVSIRMEFDVAVGANTNAYALVVSDKKLKFKSGGNRMNVVF